VHAALQEAAAQGSAGAFAAAVDDATEAGVPPAAIAAARSAFAASCQTALHALRAAALPLLPAPLLCPSFWSSGSLDAFWQKEVKRTDPELDAKFGAMEGMVYKGAALESVVCYLHLFSSCLHFIFAV
jgi:hypothetical protein